MTAVHFQYKSASLNPPASMFSSSVSDCYFISKIIDLSIANMEDLFREIECYI